MLLLLRHGTKHVLIALAVGLLLRLWFIHYYPVVDGDSLVYGEIARNWFWHGTYGFALSTRIRPTLIRLPGYPLFLAACFFLFGINQYHSVMLIQAVLDLASCLLLAGFAARTISLRTAVATLYLAALCPFTANFVAVPLTEIPTLFCIALGLYALACYVEHPELNRWFWALVLSISYGALLRPDGVLLGLVLVPAMFWYARPHIPAKRSAMLAASCTLLALVPFIPWMVRNARTMHVFQPLVPRYANDPFEPSNEGWIRWIRTWSAEYASTAEIYWNVNGSPLDIHLLPSRAFDNQAQEIETSRLFAQYNEKEMMTPELNARFEKLALQRIHRHIFGYYVLLPCTRLADMWLRPRTGMLSIHVRWWQYKGHPAETIFSLGYAALNLIYLLLAAWGLKKQVPFTAVMAFYIASRCLLLFTVETPESRYTLECFPMIFILAGAALAVRKLPTSRPLASSSSS